MMIKKQLGVLAGAVVAASSANAAITLGTANDVLVVFSNTGAGTFYQTVSGVTADALVGGGSFSLDITAATAFLGGIDSVAVLGVASAGADGAAPTSAFPGYNYDEFLYVDVGGGLVATNQTAPTTNLTSQNNITGLNSFLAAANSGVGAGEGTALDFDSNVNTAQYLISLFPNVLSLQGQRDVGASTVLSDLTGTLELSGSTLSFGSTAVVPVPAAAWLFGSALVGLGVVRRKK